MRSRFFIVPLLLICATCTPLDRSEKKTDYSFLDSADLLHRGFEYEKAGKYASAKQCYQEVIQRFPKSGSALMARDYLKSIDVKISFKTELEKQGKLSGSPILILPPSEYSRTGIHRNSAGTVVLTLDVVNIATKTIDAFKLEASCSTRFGEAVEGYGKRVFSGISQAIVNPTEIKWSQWDMFGFDLTANCEVWITVVHFANGTTWTNPEKKGAVKISLKE